MAIRIIGHLDMDAFFASLEERVNPQFKGKPIVVGSDPKNGKGRGVVSTANYKAREYGIKSALPISRAWKISEEARSQGKDEVVFLPSNFSLYERVSSNILNIIRKYSDNVEQGSIDEFYFDLSFAKTISRAEKISQEIKEEIRAREKITCSIGIGPNKLISKMAAGVNKPDGLFVVEEKEIENFLSPLPIRKIPGIGPKTAELLYSKQIYAIKDLLPFSKEQMRAMLNKHGEDIYDKIRGIDDSSIMPDRELKSIGGQTTFEEDTFNLENVIDDFLILCENIFKRFEKEGFSRFNRIVVTVRFYDFTTVSFSTSFDNNIRLSKKQFKQKALKSILLFLDKRKNPRLKPIRLIGLRIEKLSK